jgi:hypothetical protein
LFQKKDKKQRKGVRNVSVVCIVAVSRDLNTGFTESADEDDSLTTSSNASVPTVGTNAGSLSPKSALRSTGMVGNGRVIGV